MLLLQSIILIEIGSVQKILNFVYSLDKRNVINTHHTTDNLDLHDNEVHNPSHRANWSSYL